MLNTYTQTLLFQFETMLDFKFFNYFKAILFWYSEILFEAAISKHFLVLQNFKNLWISYSIFNLKSQLFVGLSCKTMKMHNYFYFRKKLLKFYINLFYSFILSTVKLSPTTLDVTQTFDTVVVLLQLIILTVHFLVQLLLLFGNLWSQRVQFPDKISYES